VCVCVCVCAWRILTMSELRSALEKVTSDIGLSGHHYQQQQAAAVREQ